jgi:ornithine cyclodeaminase/alanine dehydrogenase-like protein (mu-crystallin family)
MLYLTEQDVLRLLDMPSAIAAVERSMLSCAAGEGESIPRRRAKTRRGIFHLMGGSLRDAGVHGLKAYTSLPEGTRFFCLLFGEDGAPLALIEADHLGRIRTGAASAVATRVLARPDASVMLVIGSGAQARTQVQAVACVRRLQEVMVWSRTPEHRERFAALLREEDGLPACAVDDPGEACRKADIITTITTSREPVLFSERVPDGAHINACGSNHLSRIEIDPRLFARAACTCVDHREQALAECGELAAAVREGLTHPDRLTELPDVLAGRAQGRSSPMDVTLFESQGIGIWDVAVAEEVLRRAGGLPANP